MYGNTVIIQTSPVSKLHELKKNTHNLPVFEMCLVFFFRFFKEQWDIFQTKNERFLSTDILAFLFSASR